MGCQAGSSHRQKENLAFICVLARLKHSSMNFLTSGFPARAIKILLDLRRHGGEFF